MPHARSLPATPRASARHARLLTVALLLPVICNASAPATRTPTGGGGTVVLEPMPARESPRVWRRVIFTCTSPGLVVFADRPCGPLPTTRELKQRDPTATTSGAAASTVAPTPAATTRPLRNGPEDDGADRRDEAALRSEACRRLEGAVLALDDRMRAGYSAREAARLWSRWREAKERLREADC